MKYYTINTLNIHTAETQSELVLANNSWSCSSSAQALENLLAMQADHFAHPRRQPILYGAQKGYLSKEQFAFEEMKQWNENTFVAAKVNPMWASTAAYQ